MSGSGDKKSGGADGGGKKGRRRSSAGGSRDDLPRRLGDVITPSLDKLAGGDEARAYAAWARAVGDPVSGGTRPKAFRRGQLTVECASSVWANELTYLGPQILRRMDEVAPGHPVTKFRFIVGRLPAPQNAGFGGPGLGHEGGHLLGPEGPQRQESEPSPAKKDYRHERPAPDAHDAARAQAEGVQDGRLRAAIEAALRRSSDEPPEAPGGGTPAG